MATFTALMFSALAVAVDSLSMHDLVNNTNLSMYQDPSTFIWNHSDVYLLRVSVTAGTAQKKPQTPCVRSRYWSNTTEKVERSLDVYNKTDRSNFRSTNISLTVKKEDSQTLLNVLTNETGFFIMNISDVNITISENNSDFRVLFSDTNCLILAEKFETVLMVIEPKVDKLLTIICPLLLALTEEPIVI
ncbi:uncharacterized protein LOC125757403 [Rhipicephalus sanguineus]|uniref:uncharacterized protein LOC125757403 n=1 Tax=Rhipicephalus sanguineus TaxID=34632 RepID=UPI0020C3B1A2|nr:uncharacterized protein LOC125757403 [Rhipicephalus sanguineus]